MYIDLSVLESRERSVVRCKTEEHAQMFIDAMWEQYPKRMEGIWGRKNHNNWNHYCNNPDGICYLHRINYKDRGGVDYCQSTDLKSALEDGYVIVEFDELIGASVDFGELGASDFDIKSLFGMG